MLGQSTICRRAALGSYIVVTLHPDGHVKFTT
jgi:hypothetical protein